MRENLATLEGKRCVFRATFERYGSKPAYRGPPLTTCLFVKILGSDGKELCDHVWMIQREQLTRLGLQRGEAVEFKATVKRYTKGYRGHRDLDDAAPLSEDFKLANPRDFRRLQLRPGLHAQPTLDLLRLA